MQLDCRVLLPSRTTFCMLCRRTALVCSIPLSLPRSGARLRPMSGYGSVSAWKGLENWRVAPIDERRAWGRKDVPIGEQEPRLVAGDSGGADVLAAASFDPTTNSENSSRLSTGEVNDGTAGSGSQIANLASWGALVLATTDPLKKAWLTHQAFCLWKNGKLELGVATAPDKPGRPSKPELVPPREVPSPKECPLSPSAHMMHNLAHIELNAIDLAWDTVVRFSYASDELGQRFYDDFLHVADDESRHFRWCSQRLNELGSAYGDMPAHNLLWKDCLKTSGSVKSRLAVIPMMQEARGLDAGPRLVKRLLGLNDHRSAAIVRRIGQEEVAHVGVGVFHFLQICEKLQVDPGDEFKELMVEWNIELHGPFNHKARELAGLQRDWYDKSDQMECSRVEDHARLPSCQKQSPAMVGDPDGTEQRVDDPRKSLTVDGNNSHNGVAIDKSNYKISSSSLPEVYERLALVVAMEKENADA